MRTVAFDTETFYLKPTQSDDGYSVQNLGNWRYCADPRFSCYLVSVFDGEEAWAGHPKDLNWDALDGARLVSHNKAFDQAVYKRMVALGQAPKVNFHDWHCSANLTSFLCNRRSLAEATEHLLKLKVPKSMRDWMNGKTWDDAVKAGKDQELLTYAKDDVIHCRNIWDRYSDQWTPLERGLSELTISQCERGVAIDVDKLRRYIAVVKMVLFHIEKSLPWVAEGAKVTSPKAIAEQCRKVGIPSPPVKSHDGGEEAFIAWELEYGPRYAWVSNVSQYRSMNKILTTLETIEERLREDNTIDFSLLYFGAHTGRWSGGGSRLNMQNLRKDPIYVLDDYAIAEKEPSDVSLIREKIDMRSLFIPRPGHKFVICDLSQIEPRVLNWLCGNFALLERLKGGMSIYEAHARDTMGWTGGDLKKENPALYKAAKARVLGLGYGCGAKKFKEVAKTLADLDVTPEEAKPMVEGFRKDNPKIVNLWQTLDDQFRKSAGGVFEMGLPSGRTMRYEDIAYERRPYKTDEGKMAWKSVLTANIGGKRKILYGGLLTENLVQATSRDVFGEHLLALERAGINTLFSVHDEALTEVPESADPEEVKEIMSQTPEWIDGCPIGAEAVVATHYLK
jgi:DNA polymerase I-like protein with 3'-5' exonuclease and polymerase domains